MQNSSHSSGAGVQTPASVPPPPSSSAARESMSAVSERVTTTTTNVNSGFVTRAQLFSSADIGCGAIAGPSDASEIKSGLNESFGTK